MPLLGLRILMVAAIALYLVPTGAHLFELPAKMALSASDYMVVQRLYAGWALFGVAILAAILLTSLHALLRRRHRGVRILSLAAILCLIGTQAIF